VHQYVVKYPIIWKKKQRVSKTVIAAVAGQGCGDLGLGKVEKTTPEK
jgi:hypothetical protein